MTLECLNDVSVNEVIRKRKNYYLKCYLAAFIGIVISFAVLHYKDVIKNDPVTITYDENGDLSYESKMHLANTYGDKFAIGCVLIMSFFAAAYFGYKPILDSIAFAKTKTSFSVLPHSEHEACLQWNESSLYHKKLTFAVAVDENWVTADAKPGMILTDLNPRSLVSLFAMDENQQIYYITTR